MSDSMFPLVGTNDPMSILSYGVAASGWASLHRAALSSGREEGGKLGERLPPHCARTNVVSVLKSFTFISQLMRRTPLHIARCRGWYFFLAGVEYVI